MNSYTFLLQDYLKKIGIGNNIIIDICNLFNVKMYSKSENYANEENTSDKVAFVINGIFFIYTIDENGNILVKNFLIENEFLLASFEPSLLASVSIKSLTKSIVLEAKYSEVLTLYDQYPDLKEVARKGMEKRFLSLHKRYDEFATKNANERYNIFKNNFGDKEHLIPQYLIASYLGITPTQLSRIRNP